MPNRPRAAAIPQVRSRADRSNVLKRCPTQSSVCWLASWPHMPLPGLPSFTSERRGICRGGSACCARGRVPRFWARDLDARHASGANDKDVLLANPAGLADPHDDSGSNAKAPVTEPLKKVDRSGRPTAAPTFGITAVCRLGSDGPSSEGTTMAAAFEEDGRAAGRAVYAQDERLRVCRRESEGPLHRDGYRSPNTNSHRCRAGGRRGEIAVPGVGCRDSVRTRRPVTDRARGRRGRRRQQRAATPADRPSLVGEHDRARRRK